jgi:hypothetical protein
VARRFTFSRWGLDPKPLEVQPGTTSSWVSAALSRHLSPFRGTWLTVRWQKVKVESVWSGGSMAVSREADAALYDLLGTSLLSRHFALGRRKRANLFFSSREVIDGSGGGHQLLEGSG